MLCTALLTGRLSLSDVLELAVMLTCKLLLAAAKAIVDVGPDMSRQS